MPPGSKIPDPICLPVTPAGGTVSGKIKLNGPGTYFIDIYQTDSETNFNRTDDDIVALSLDPTDQVQWSFEPKNSTTCIFARMQTKTKIDSTGSIVPAEWANSEIKCGLKPGDKDVILTINGPAAEKYTISGTISLTGGTLSGKEYVVSLSLYNPVNDRQQERPIHTQRIVTKANIGYTIPSRYAGFYTSQAILYESGGTTKLYEVNDKYDLRTNISRDIPLVVPEDKTLPKYAITIKASKPTTVACPTATSPTISAYCLLGKVFNEQKGTVKLTIKDKAASNEKYRKYEGTIELGGGLRSNVMGIDIFEVSSASPISAGQVQSAQVGDNSIVFDPRLLDIKVTP